MTSAIAITPRDRLIVALDVPSLEEASALVHQLGDSVSFYKIGMELVYGGGLALAERLVGEGKKVFLDLKLHDIPQTVERATAQIARLGVHFLTIHAYPQTMKAAKAGALQGSVAARPLRLLAVTVMTSYDDHDLASAGYGLGVADLVRCRAVQAEAAGIDGLILSGAEVVDMRAIHGDRLLLVTPGIRPQGADIGDQKRVMTPHEAIVAGADHLVIGRPVTKAKDPKGMADAIVADIAQALVTKAL